MTVVHLNFKTNTEREKFIKTDVIAFDIDNDGTVRIASVDGSSGREAQSRIELITAEVEVGKLEAHEAQKSDYASQPPPPPPRRGRGVKAKAKAKAEAEAEAKKTKEEGQ